MHSHVFSMFLHFMNAEEIEGCRDLQYLWRSWSPCLNVRRTRDSGYSERIVVGMASMVDIHREKRGISWKLTQHIFCVNWQGKSHNTALQPGDLESKKVSEISGGCLRTEPRKITLLLLPFFWMIHIILNYLVKQMKCISLRCANGTRCSDFSFCPWTLCLQITWELFK